MSLHNKATTGTEAVIRALITSPLDPVELVVVSLYIFLQCSKLFQAQTLQTCQRACAAALIRSKIMSNQSDIILSRKSRK